MRCRKHTAADAAAIQEMRKTMTVKAIAESRGVNRSVIFKVLNEHSETRGGAEHYRPRALAQWPAHTDFTPDEVRAS